jgi:hypothetical protein
MPVTLAANLAYTITLTGVTNPVYSPVAGVILNGYAIRNRMIVA